MIDRILKGLQAIPQRIKQAFQKRPDRFLERLRQQARITEEAADALRDYLNKPSRKNAQRIGDLEKNGDELRRILTDELNRTFVVPIDREDIQRLSRAIDDILDEIWATVNEMDILSVTPNAFLRDMAELIYNEAEEIKLAMDRIPLHPGVATTHAIRARANDNRIETLYAESLADLFRQPKDLDSVVTMLKLREIYRHLFHASGRATDAANIIEDVIVKFF